MYDAIIVGGRCAGSATALLLARKGYRVLVIDRATFPSDTISGHCIWHWGAVKLKQWGLFDQVLDSGCPPITHISSNFGDFTLTGHIPTVNGVPAALGPRRTVLDSILLNAAAEAGAEIRQGCVVDILLIENERVVGIEAHELNGKRFSESAKIVIGADGKHSKIAQLVNAPTYKVVPSLTCWYMSYWSDFPCDGLEIHWRQHRLALVMPTNDNLVLHAIAWPHAEFKQFRSNIEKHFVDTLSIMPEIAERLPHAKRATEFVGMADVPNFFRRPYGNGWALVGDAGHHKDPVPAYGISDAFCDAELLADAVDLGLSGQQALDDALAHYEQRRNERAFPDHEATCQRSHLVHWDNPDMLRLRSALRHNEDDTNRFFAAIARLPGAQSFFAPENLQRIMQQAALTPQQ
jgi:2-polyprenyl-6-methoxyphenol hydroxylase-like FAD-dependent oxidoreductase